MKRKINEEEYNQVIKLGICDNENQALDIVYELQDNGIESYNKGNIVYISAEQDRNNPHYIDEIQEYAMNIFNKKCNTSNKMKLACSKQKNMKITETKLKSLIKESVKKALTETNLSNIEKTELLWRDTIKAEGELVNELVAMLKKYGIKTASAHKFPSGRPCVAISSDEHYNSSAEAIAKSFAKRKNCDINVTTYPATVFYALEER